MPRLRLAKQPAAQTAQGGRAAQPGYWPPEAEAQERGGRHGSVEVGFPQQQFCGVLRVARLPKNRQSQDIRGQSLVAEAMPLACCAARWPGGGGAPSAGASACLLLQLLLLYTANMKRRSSTSVNGYRQLAMLRYTGTVHQGPAAARRHGLSRRCRLHAQVLPVLLNVAGKQTSGKGGWAGGGKGTCICPESSSWHSMLAGSLVRWRRQAGRRGGRRARSLTSTASVRLPPIVAAWRQLGGTANRRLQCCMRSNRCCKPTHRCNPNSPAQPRAAAAAAGCCMPLPEPAWQH